MARLAQARHGFGPTKYLFDPLSDAQADLVAGMTGRPPIDGRTSPVGILRHVRSYVDLTEFGDEVLRVEPFVAAQGDGLRPVGVRFDQMQCRQPLGMARSARRGGADNQPVAVLHQCMPHEAELRLLAGTLAIQPSIRISRGGMRVVAALLAVKVSLPIASRIRRRTGAVLRAEALGAGPGLQQRAVDREMLG